MKSKYQDGRNMEEKTKKSNKKVSLLIKAVIVLVVVVIAFFLSQYVAEKNEKAPALAVSASMHRWWRTTTQH